MPCKKDPKNCSSLSAEFKKAVTDYLLVETELAPADIAIIFGSDGRKHLAEKGAELYHNKLVEKIVVTGGVKRHFSKTEAIDIRDRLVKLGIPKGDIIVENRATNTGENVIYSKELIKHRLGLKNVNSIIAVGNVSASRRFIMTIKRHWPEAFVMMAPANPYGVSKDKWYTLQRFKCTVLRQNAKIKPYFKKGFIEEVDIDDINRQARQMRRKV